jgi:intracellular multiplication protein IcmS
MDINKQLVALAKALRCNFTLRDQPIAAEQVFSEIGLLPAIMRRADQLSSFCLGYGLGLSFEEAPNTMQGTKVKFDDKTPNSLRVMCAADVMIEFMQNAPTRSLTPLDDLLYD